MNLKFTMKTIFVSVGFRNLMRGAIAFSYTKTTCISIISSSVNTRSRHFTALSSSSMDTMPSLPTWYTDADLGRSDLPIMSEETLKKSRFVFTQTDQSGKTNHLYMEKDEAGPASPLFLSYDEMTKTLGDDKADSLLDLSDEVSLLKLWIGERGGIDYFAIHEKTNHDGENVEINAENAIEVEDADMKPKLAPLREFGDRIPASVDSAIYSTANGLVEFHKSHKFCSHCGKPTKVRKVGASRICSDHKSIGGSCRSPSVYPRIDLASIMLVTSPCENYCLLGRKSMWPKGRYSTLAGFLEVGETIENCCIRETFEESGIDIERGSVEFVKSQPWPFPRSLMVGFRAKARHNDAENKSKLPIIDFDEKEMEDVRWFSRDYVAERLDGGSTALLYDPTEEEMEFHIPGKASLARLLITEWALE